MKKPVPVTARTATLVIERHFRKKPAAVNRIHGGLANHVFEVRVGREEFILRISQKPAQLQKFMKEQWAVTAVRKIKVPTPEILEVDNDVIGLPYMILHKVNGSPADSVAVGRQRLAVLRALGECTARINSIKTHDFGHIFDWSPNALSRNPTWSDYLDFELRVEQRMKTLAHVVSRVALKELRRRVEQVRRWTNKPTLSHGDIRLKNVLLDQKQKIIAIIDWENSTSNIAPYWELSIALHDLTIDEKQAFLEGYGMDLKDYMRSAPAMKALNILNYSRAVYSAMKHRDKRRLLDIRARLSGAFDLYSL